MKKIVIPLIIFNSQLLTFNCSDPFWSVNQPGNLWNCKCDWEETDAPIYTKELTAEELAKARKEGGGIHANGLEGNPAVTGEIFTQGCTYFKNAGKNRKERDSVEGVCEIAAHKYFKITAKDNPLLSQTFPCEINGVMQDIHFADWGISETAYSMHGKKNLYWLKNEVLLNPSNYFQNAHYVKDADVDLSHNTGKTLRLKSKFKKYYYSKITLSNGQPAYLNIVLHEDGNYYLYTISRNITSYKKE